MIKAGAKKDSKTPHSVRNARSVEKRYSPSIHLHSVRNVTIAEGCIPNGMRAKE